MPYSRAGMKTQGRSNGPGRIAAASFPQAPSPMAAPSPTSSSATGSAGSPITQGTLGRTNPRTTKVDAQPQVAAPPVVMAPAMGMGAQSWACRRALPALRSDALSGIPVNQIVEKMGQVLGGQSQGATSEAQESRWDVPIQERAKTAQVSQEMQPVAAPPPMPVAAVQQASGWGQPAFEAAPPAQAAAAPASESAAWGSNTNSWGQEPASVPVAAGWDKQPAAVPSNGGWGAGESIPQPVAQPTSTWGQPAGGQLLGGTCCANGSHPSKSDSLTKSNTGRCCSLER